MEKYNELTAQEQAVILHKGTEAPHSGQFNNFDQEGVYLCKQCNLPLFLSSAKFSSSCGWPSFDDQIANNVQTALDKDMERTEIICSRCGAHLGHQFKGEELTKKNLRNCVNSISLNFISSIDKNSGLNRAIFAAGCFWGVEKAFKDVSGVIATKVGYVGGQTVSPTYEQVCSGQTGHAEAVELLYDLRVINFSDLVKKFLQIHDPSQYMRQGPDVGSQYRSAIFYLTITQKNIALSIIEELKKQGDEIVTEVMPASQFFIAENYHQNYLD